MKFWTLLYALFPQSDYAVPLGYYPSAYECGAKIAEYDVSEGWSFHCHITEERSNPLRPRVRKDHQFQVLVE
jgi:hypothetical protein